MEFDDFSERNLINNSRLLAVPESRKKKQKKERQTEEKKETKVGYCCAGSAAFDVPVNQGRSEMVDSLHESLGLLEKMERIAVVKASKESLTTFHDKGYIEAVFNGNYADKYGLEYDCSPFPLLSEHVKLVAGSTLSACVWMSLKEHSFRPIAMNFHGGRHHAFSSKASGYCFVNDVLLAILFLKKRGLQRIAYIDIDCHHCDAVEAAVEDDPDVLCLSSHLWELGFFPGSGSKGNDKNVHNYPMSRGSTDEDFTAVLGNMLEKVQAFIPEVIILQMGADSLKNDKLGGLNLTEKSYGDLLKSVMKFPVPILVLGGGGYDNVNAAKLWTYCSSVILETDYPEQVPEKEKFFLKYKPDFITKIH